MRVSALYVNASGAPTDPTVATVKWKSGSGATQSNTPTRDTQGAYHQDLDTTGWTGPGNQRWTYQFTGTGTVQGINSGTFEVEPPAL